MPDGAPAAGPGRTDRDGRLSSPAADAERAARSSLAVLSSSTVAWSSSFAVSSSSFVAWCSSFVVSTSSFVGLVLLVAVPQLLVRRLQLLVRGLELFVAVEEVAIRPDEAIELGLDPLDLGHLADDVVIPGLGGR